MPNITLSEFEKIGGWAEFAKIITKTIPQFAEKTLPKFLGHAENLMSQYGKFIPQNLVSGETAGAFKGVDWKQLLSGKNIRGTTPFTLKSGARGYSFNIPHKAPAGTANFTVGKSGVAEAVATPSSQMHLYQKPGGGWATTTAPFEQLQKHDWKSMPFGKRHPGWGAVAGFGKGVAGAGGLGAVGLSMGALPALAGEYNY
jgi:hypothetical protein